MPTIQEREETRLSFKRKNADRKVGRDEAGNTSDARHARTRRRMCGGSFGKAHAKIWNAMIVGTTGSERTATKEDFKDESTGVE